MHYFAESNKGCMREMNEDNYCYGSSGGGALFYFAVADGMGGYKAGEIASSIAVETLKDAIPDIDFTDKNSLENIVKTVYGRANRKIIKNALENSEHSDMGTTFVMCFTDGRSKIITANMGDSRAYLISDKTISRITADHSYVEYLVKTGMIDRKTAENHPDKNLITKALGKNETAEPDIFGNNVKKGDRLILCTDGLTDMVNEEEILRIAGNSENGVERACHLLVKGALEAGGKDNVTVVIAEF